MPFWPNDDVLIIECRKCGRQALETDEGWHRCEPDPNIQSDWLCPDCTKLDKPEEDSDDSEDDELEPSDFMRGEFEHDRLCRRFGIPNGDRTLNPDGTGKDGE